MTDVGLREKDAPQWLGHPGSVRPTVLILGGFLTAPPMYGPLVRRLMDRGAAGAIVANVWTPDWLLSGVRGIGPICTRSARALRSAVHLSDEVSAGAPLLVVGHSAGGITGRLLTAPEPLPGRRFGAARLIGAIVTLGTPHRLAAGEGIGRRIRDVAASIADEAVPGAFYAPQIGYLSVTSRAIVGDPSGTGRERVAVHGPGAAGPWYGCAEEVDVWWPVALETWRSALEQRARAREEQTTARASAAGL